MNSSLLAAVAVAVALAFHAGCREADPPPPSPKPSPAHDRAIAQAETETGRLEVTVKRVIDGDTVLVSGLPTGTGLVRLTGVNAPETGEGRTKRECFGAEARRWLADKAPRGSRLSLVFDVGQRDRFGRVLAYVYRADGTFLNAALVENGYAHTMTIPPNVRHANELQELQRSARSQKRGLWGACRERRVTLDTSP
jgi:micrococcal nuclease